MGLRTAGGRSWGSGCFCGFRTSCRFELCNRCAGDTLWAIASEHKRKGQDVRDYVDEILKVNGLKSPSLRVGQKLLLP
ncbi:LysM peptidoglycan-binding domain-containing protein [Paenibacillus sp. P26]|nr:LysM peptidoglycan-binding domain-containing protein [Paenibacillus sp. P26]